MTSPVPQRQPHVPPSTPDVLAAPYLDRGAKVLAGALSYLRPELRMALARELRQALRLECARPVAHETKLELQR